MQQVNCHRLVDRVAVVTGAGGYIGRATALRLAQEGADIVVNDIVIEQANKVVDEIKSLGQKAIAVKANVTKSQEVNQIVKATLDEFGKIDILVNMAGGGAKERASIFSESSEEVWDFVIGLNLKGTMNCSLAVIKHMMDRKSGKIINISSVAGMIGSFGIVDYSSAKGGIQSFTKALAKEVSSYGINVNCVAPGSIGFAVMPPEQIQQDMELAGLPRQGKPEDIAAAIAFLVSDDADFITGQLLAVCGLRNLGFHGTLKR